MAVNVGYTETQALEQGSTPRWRALRLLVRKKIAMVAITYLLIFYGVGFLAPVVAPHDPNRG